MHPTFAVWYSFAVNALSGAYTYDELKEYFNFGLAEIETNGNLTFSVIANSNEVRVSTTISISIPVIL